MRITARSQKSRPEKSLVEIANAPLWPQYVWPRHAGAAIGGVINKKSGFVDFKRQKHGVKRP